MVPPFLITLTVLLVGIGDRQLWRDENATWWAASQSVDGLRKLVEVVDAVLFPYYVLMHGWTNLFGDSETALRMPSAIFMALSAAVVALIGRRLFDATAGLAAGLLVAAVPVISRYGQEARPYAMAVLASVVAVWLLLRALERPTVWHWLGYAVAVLWVGCSHVVALMALAAHGVAALAAVLRARGSERLRILVGWPVAVVGALSAFLPVLVAGQRQGRQISWIPDPTWRRVRAFPGELFLSPSIAGFFLVLGLAGIVALVVADSGKRRWTGAFLALWALLPPVLAYSTFDRFHFFLPRYLLFTVPAWILLASWAIRRALAKAATAKVLLVTMVAGAGVAYAGWDEQRAVRSDAVENEFAFREAAAYIAARDRPGDGVIFTGYPYLHRGFRYEWRGQPLAEQPREVLVDQDPADAYSWVHRPCADPAVCLGDTPRIWLVSSDPEGGPLAPLPADQEGAVQARYGVGSQAVFHRLRVTELIREPGK
ncbi:glycosyltransferase family 39 protein [Actinoplanes sp. NPDC049548]|uniref:glycosyltransferase family 39 protein n=1 Tax=Actinoplanes sp. NPDC049548 TaxID=3155152 RepID=UPI003423F0ED